MDSASSANELFSSSTGLIAFAFLLTLLVGLLCLRIVRDPEMYLQRTGNQRGITADDPTDRDQLLLNTRRRGYVGLGLVCVCLVILGIATVGLRSATRRLAEFEADRHQLVQSLRTQTAHVKKHQATSELDSGIKLLEEVVKTGEADGTIDQEKLNEALKVLDRGIGKLNGVAEIYQEAIEANEKLEDKE
tara:strand:- start:13936 stop:14505 length:570 start_codon:yes stop_codon:yes gene_type:complete